MEKKQKNSIFNIILVIMLILSAMMGIFLIVLSRNKTEIEVIGESGEKIKSNYATTESTSNTWDISATENDEVTATLSDDGVLTISGKGNMKCWDWLGDNVIPWIGEEENIKSVIIENGVTNIGNCAFYNCISLTQIEIPSSVTSIGIWAFWRCISLTSIDIPDSVTDIGWSAFEGCESLTEVEIPNSITSIGVSIFKECRKLTKIDIPSSVISIEADAFDYCTSLTNIEVNENNTNYMDDNGVLYTKDQTKIIRYPAGKTETEYVIPSSVTSIYYRAFYGCSSLTEIEIPSSVTNIGDCAFSECTSLTEIEIPSTVTSIESAVFSKCSSLTEIKIPSSVTSIGYEAFESCTSLTTITIPSSVINIEGSAFSNCTRLTNIEVNEANTVYIDNNGILYTKDQTEIIKYPAGKTEIEYIIFNGVTNIGDYAFENCTVLTKIEIPSSAISIGRCAFSGCSSLIKIEIPSNVASIGSRAFENCTSLAKIEIPSSVTDIGEKAFYSSRLTIAVETGKDEQEIMPEILKRALDEKDILHTTKALHMSKNCTLNETKDKIKIAGTTGYIAIDDGVLNGFVVEIVPSGTITYSTTSYTKGKVRAVLHIAEGEKITNNDESDIYTFVKNGKFTFTYVTKNGEERTATAQVDNIYYFNVAQYVIEGQYITKVQPNTKYEDFIKNIQINMSYTIKEGENVVDSTSIIKTGQVLKIGDDSYTIIVTGDCNGDGQAELKDILAINKHRLNKASLTAEYLKSADVNGDGVADLKDILQINKFRLGKIEEL